MAQTAYALISPAAILLGAILIAVSWGPLHNLFEEYQDSPTSTYLILGLPPLLIGAACVLAGLWGVVRFAFLGRSRADSE
jgi:hypothetical protein